MSYRQMIAPLRSDGSDFHKAPNNTNLKEYEPLAKLAYGPEYKRLQEEHSKKFANHRCSLCGWLTQGIDGNPHRRREDGKGWEVINSHGFIVFHPAPLISEEQAIALIKNVNVDLKVPCQNCARYGGRVVSHKVAGGHVSQWECPHCLIHLGGKKPVEASNG